MRQGQAVRFHGMVGAIVEETHPRVIKVGYSRLGMSGNASHSMTRSGSFGRKLKISRGFLVNSSFRSLFNA